jgi:hypothetical protein
LIPVGTSFSSSIQVNGKVFAADYEVPTPGHLTTATTDKTAAYNDAAGRTSPDFMNLAGGLIGGLTLTPGLYKWNSAVSVASDVVLHGDADAVWIFQIDEYLSVEVNQNFILSGGANEANVFWQVAGHVVVKTNAHLEGIILSNDYVAFQEWASLNGRIFGVAATLIKSVITEPGHHVDLPLQPVDLGTAANYVILTTAGVTNVPGSDIIGDIGVSPIAATGITGMALVLEDPTMPYSTSAEVTGKIWAADYHVPTPATLTTAILGTYFKNL